MSKVPQKKSASSLKYMRWAIIILPIGFISLAGITLITDYQQYVNPNSPTVFGTFLLVELGKYWSQVGTGIFLYFPLIFTLRERTFMQDQLKQAESKQDIASEPLQPKPNPAALPLPFHMWLSPSKRRRVDGIVGMLVFIGIIMTALVFSVGLNEHPDWIVGLVVTGVFLVLLLLAALVFSFIESSGHTHYEFTDQGIMMSRIGRTWMVEWHDARSFVVRTMSASPKGRSWLYFEIVGVSGQKISWGPLRENYHAVSTSEQCFLSIIEFNACIIPQINALVAGQTGLTLLDQRLDKNQGDGHFPGILPTEDRPLMA